MDPIADLLIRIKNKQKTGRQTMEVPFSGVKNEIVKILVKEGFLEGFERKGSKSTERLELKLKYAGGEPAIQDARRISRPGQRIYLKAAQIKSVKQGYGLAVISTPQGLMTDKEARKMKIGGEVLFEIW